MILKHLPIGRIKIFSLRNVSVATHCGLIRLFLYEIFTCYTHDLVGMPIFTITCKCLYTCGMWYYTKCGYLLGRPHILLIARCMGPSWGPPGDDRTQMGPMLAPWTLLSGWPSLVQIMACRLVVAKPLSKPVMVYYWFDPQEQASMKFQHKL